MLNQQRPLQCERGVDGDAASSVAMYFSVPSNFVDIDLPINFTTAAAAPSLRIYSGRAKGQANSCASGKQAPMGVNKGLDFRVLTV